MKSFEENSHSFVVRVWIESRELTGMEPQLRGMIEHVPSYTRCYFSNFCQMKKFIFQYFGGLASEAPRDRLGWLKTWITKYIRFWEPPCG